MRLHCSTQERFPIRLVDVTELFFHELRARGVEQTWYCQPSNTPGPMRRVRAGAVGTHGDGTDARAVGTDAHGGASREAGGVEIVVPPTFGRGGALGKVATRLGYWLIETWLLFTLLWRRVDAILIRDKYWGALVGLLVARLTGARLLIWLSYPFPEHEREEAQDARGLRRLMLRARALTGEAMLYGIAMPRADHCFVQSEQMKRDLAARGIPTQRMTAVPMGITRRFFDDHPPGPTRAAGDAAFETAPPGDAPLAPLVLHLGTLASVRRLEVLVDAFAIVAARRADVRFRFVGDGDLPHERARLEQRAREAGIADRVEFTGFVPMARAWAHVEAAGVCVSPFRVTPVLRVASPTKFIEYLAFAKPTVANDHPEHSMIAKACDGARISDWSAQGFADAIVWCLANPADARAMGLRGREWVRAHRTYDRLADLVHARLVEIVGPDEGRSAR
ncbi:MAG: glycosyltransferase [Lautropia sp.]